MTPYEIASKRARQVYDQDILSDADNNFLLAIAAASKDYADALNATKRDFPGDTVALEAVKRLATRRMHDAYAAALHELESEYEDEPVYLIAEAAE